MNTHSLTIVTFLTCSSLLAISAESEVKKELVSMKNIQTMCKALYTQIVVDPNCPKFEPELIIGLTRGGLIPLGILAGEPLFNNRNVKTIAVTSYSDSGQQTALKPLFALSDIELEDLKRFKSILIVDDLVDSGKSLAWVTTLLREKLPDATIKTAALFYKERSFFKPDYYVEKTTSWIVFPWEE